MVHESLSALLDGECSAAEMDRLLDEIERDPALKVAWSRMCQAREAREGTRITQGQVCISAAVMARLDTPAPVSASNKVVPLTAPPPRQRFDWKPWSGWAVAASVAVVAVALNLGGNRADVSSPDAGGGAGFAPQISTPVSAPMSIPRARNLQTVSLSPDEQAADDDLRDYLIEHSNAADRNMSGTLSYARFAAHTTADFHAQAAVYSPEGQP